VRRYNHYLYAYCIILKRQQSTNHFCFLFKYKLIIDLFGTLFLPTTECLYERIKTILQEIFLISKRPISSLILFWLFFQDFDKSSLIRNHTIAIRLYYKYHIIDSITRKTVIISRITNLSMRLMIFCFLYNNNNFSKIELRNVVNNIKSIAPQPFQCLIHHIINNIILSLLSWYDMLLYFECYNEFGERSIY